MPPRGLKQRYSKSRSREKPEGKVAGLARKETLQVGLPLWMTSESKNGANEALK